MRIAIGWGCADARIGTPGTHRGHLAANNMHELPKRLFLKHRIRFQDNVDPLILPHAHRHARIDYIGLIFIPVRILRLMGIPQNLGFRFDQRAQITEEHRGVMFLQNGGRQNAAKVRDFTPIFEDIKMRLDAPTQVIHGFDGRVGQEVGGNIGHQDFGFPGGQLHFDDPQRQLGPYGHPMSLLSKFPGAIGRHRDGDVAIAADRRELLRVKSAGHSHEIGLALRIEFHPKRKRWEALGAVQG